MIDYLRARGSLLGLVDRSVESSAMDIGSLFCSCLFSLACRFLSNARRTSFLRRKYFSFRDLYLSSNRRFSHLICSNSLNNKYKKHNQIKNKLDAIVNKNSKHSTKTGNFLLNVLNYSNLSVGGLSALQIFHGVCGNKIKL